MWEWLDSLSLWWYIAAVAFVLTMTWLSFEIHRAPMIHEDEPEQQRPKKQAPN